MLGNSFPIHIGGIKVGDILKKTSENGLRNVYCQLFDKQQHAK